jgi:hypothetical protein
LNVIIDNFRVHSTYIYLFLGYIFLPPLLNLLFSQWNSYNRLLLLSLLRNFTSYWSLFNLCSSWILCFSRRIVPSRYRFLSWFVQSLLSLKIRVWNFTFSSLLRIFALKTVSESFFIGALVVFHNIFLHFWFILFIGNFSWFLPLRDRFGRSGCNRCSWSLFWLMFKLTFSWRTLYISMFLPFVVIRISVFHFQFFNHCFIGTYTLILRN